MTDLWATDPTRSSLCAPCLLGETGSEPCRGLRSPVLFSSHLLRLDDNSNDKATNNSAREIAPHVCLGDRSHAGAAGTRDRREKQRRREPRIRWHQAPWSPSGATPGSIGE